LRKRVARRKREAGGKHIQEFAAVHGQEAGRF
jgi:hypothetical protein